MSHPLDPESDPDGSAYDYRSFITMLEQRALKDPAIAQFVHLDSPGFGDEEIVMLAIGGLNRMRSTHSGGCRHAWALNSDSSSVKLVPVGVADVVNRIEKHKRALLLQVMHLNDLIATTLARSL